MSQIKTTEIEGDVAIGRHVTAGGSAIVRGNAKIGHNLRVEGWLDAPNIKGPAKGLFADEAALNAAYPLPEKGWWALVGDSVPAAVYTVKDGEWTATGKTAGTLTLDVEQYSKETEKLIGELAELRQDVAENAADIDALATKHNEDINTEAEARKAGDAALQTRVGAAEGALSAEKSERTAADAALQTALEALKARVSQGEGRIDTNESDIATLQDDLQSVAQALNALSGSGDTTAVIDTFKEVVDFLAGITNDETLSAKLMELKGLLKDHGDDIEGLKEQVTQITQTVDEDRELQNAQGTAISQMQKDLGEAQNELGELSQMLVDYEDDAALALSLAEARLGRRIDAVGILPFNAIVEAHGSVSDGAPDYATQFPSTADGAYRHIIFDKSRGTFLWEIHAGDYPNCPAGDAYSAWTGSEEYVSDGHPRADRLYRMGNELYRWKDGVLQPIEAPNGTLTLETGEASYDIPISVGASVKKKKVGRYEDMVLTASIKNNELYLKTSRPLADDEYAALLTCGKTKNTRYESGEDYYSRYRWHVRHQLPADGTGDPTGRGCTFEVEADGLWLCNGVTIRERLAELSRCGTERPRAYRCQRSRMLLHPGQTVTVTYGVAIYMLDETRRLRRKSNVVYFYVDYFATSDEELVTTTIRI